MNHPFDKWTKLELVSLIVVLVIGVVAVARSLFILTLLGLYGIGASLMFGGLAALSVHQQSQALKQFARGVMLIIMASFLALGI